MESLNIFRYLLLLESKSCVRFIYSILAWLFNYYHHHVLLLGLTYDRIVFRPEYGQTCATPQTVIQIHYECVLKCQNHTMGQ